MTKLNAKHLTRSMYTKYKIVIEFNDGNIETHTYENYYYGDKDDILEHFIEPKNSMIISNGRAVPYASAVKEIKAEVVDKTYGYYRNDSYLSWLGSWQTKEQLEENYKKYEKEIKLKY